MNKIISVIVLSLTLMTAGCMPLIVGGAIGAGAAGGYYAVNHYALHVDKKK